MLLHIPVTMPRSSSAERAARDRNRLARLFISAGVMGAALSLLVITMDGILRPGYSAISQAISDLGGGQHAWVLNKDLIATGLLIMLFAVGARGAMGGALGQKSVNAMTALFLLAGAGIANDGVFTEYKALQLHILGFYTAVTALTLAFFLVGARLLRLRDDQRWRWRRYGWYSLLTGLVVLLLIVVYVALPTYATDFQGLIERMIVGAAFGWQIVTGCQLLRQDQLEHMGDAQRHISGAAQRRWRESRGYDGGLPHRGVSDDPQKAGRSQLLAQVD